MSPTFFGVFNAFICVIKFYILILFRVLLLALLTGTVLMTLLGIHRAGRGKAENEDFGGKNKFICVTTRL